MEIKDLIKHVQKGLSLLEGVDLDNPDLLEVILEVINDSIRILKTIESGLEIEGFRNKVLVALSSASVEQHKKILQILKEAQ